MTKKGSSHIIIVPVYKPILEGYEKLAFEQCCNIFHNHFICLLTYAELACSDYYSVASSCHKIILRENFPKRFFDGIEGYNQLMLSRDFYARFATYDYMLIFQLDAWVFKDDLDLWCSKGYDYIGAPWFEENSSHETGAKLWAVGNGGFSLRRIKTFIDLFDNNAYAYSFRHFIKETLRNKRIISRNAFFRGGRKRFADLINEWNDAEDLFYCLRLKGTQLELKIPSIEEALLFAFEQSPSYLFGLTKALPFGCHAWRKYDYSFWRPFIEKD